DMRADRAGTLSLAGLLVVTTTLAMAAPIVFTRAADAALPSMMAAAPLVQRDLAFPLDGRLDGTASDALAGVRAAGDRIQADLPPSLAGLIDPGVTGGRTAGLGGGW